MTRRTSEVRIGSSSTTALTRSLSTALPSGGGVGTGAGFWAQAPTGRLRISSAGSRPERTRLESLFMGLMLASGPIMIDTGAPPQTALKVGLAQIDSRLGDVERNVERHLDFIARARGAGVDLLV